MILEGKNKLYLPVLLACAAGYLWLAFTVQQQYKHQKGFEACFIKRFTHLPCPSCGSTRAVLSITNGKFTEALLTNPVGFLLALILVIVPVWILVDWFRRSASFYQFYQSAQKRLYKPYFAIPLVLLIVINWIWNISKGL